MKFISYFKICLLLVFTAPLLFSSSIEGNNIEKYIGEVDYFFCIDGGGTKTAMQIVDRVGNPILLTRGEEQSYLIQGDCSNVVVVGKEGVHDVFKTLFDGLLVGENQIPVAEIIPKSVFFGGFAGVGRPASKNQMLEVVESFGFDQSLTQVYTDAGLALELVGENGGIFISGTGSICFIKEKNELKRIGGLGYRIGDKGSGYDIGLTAIRAAIEEEYRYGQQTSLSPLIREHFNVEQARDLIGPISGNQISPGTIASFAPFVFQEAWKGDRVAFQIVEYAAGELGELLATGVKQTDLKHCLTYLIGGLFQSPNANSFIQLICRSPEMQKLRKGARPLLVNLSEKMIPTLVIQEKLRAYNKESFAQLSSLPVVDKVMSEDHRALYNQEFLNSSSPVGNNAELSQTFHENRLKGLEMLQKLDYSILDQSRGFIEQNFEKLTSHFIKKIQAGGRLIFVGRGTSGRLSVDFAAKWKEFWKTQSVSYAPFYENSVVALIQGGAKAFVIPKEEFKDLKKDGYEAIKDLNVSSKDIVVILSATGTPKFHLGVAKAVNEAKGECYYYYQPVDTPEATIRLFEKEHVTPLVVNLDSETILGSNRLQWASLTGLNWGLVLDEMLHNLIGLSEAVDKSRAYEQVNTLRSIWDNVAKNLEDVKKIVDMQVQVFSDKDANFWKAYDSTYHGYVTLLAHEDCLRDVMIDITETPPIFSSNPPRTILEKGKKKAEYRAYLPGDLPNNVCWERMLAREMQPHESAISSELIVSTKEQGYGDYIGRTISNKNLLIGAFSSSLEIKKALEINLELIKAKDRGLKTALIVIEEEGFPLDDSLKAYLDQNDACIHLKNIPYGQLHIMKSLALKQVMNLISNGAMYGMNKVYGNVMIDIASSEEEVIDRTIRIVQGIYSDHHPNEPPFKYEFLYHLVTRAVKYKQLMELQIGKHIPSPAKVVITMLEKNCDVEKAVAKLKINNENLQLILNEI